MELYRRYRPKTLKGIVGQEGTTASLQRMMDLKKVPHCLLFTGPSGCGKTTIARIVKDFLGCNDADFQEINCADFKGIEMVRDIRRSANLSPMCGDVRVWLIDECHQLTKDAQNAFLKLLEDTPSHAYFMLATTDPQKLLKTILTRSTEVKLELLDQFALERVVQRVVDKEAAKMSPAVVTEIAEASDGSARKALVILQQVIDIAGDDAQIAGIRNSTINKDLAIELARAMINPRAAWPVVAKILRELKDEPEGIRYLVLGYAKSVLLGGGQLAPRAFKIIDIFSKNFYDSKHAGLVAACYEVVTTKD